MLPRSATNSRSEDYFECTQSTRATDTFDPETEISWDASSQRTYTLSQPYCSTPLSQIEPASSLPVPSPPVAHIAALSLTPEQLERISRNRAEALARREKLTKTGSRSSVGRTLSHTLSGITSCSEIDACTIRQIYYRECMRTELLLCRTGEEFGF